MNHRTLQKGLIHQLSPAVGGLLAGIVHLFAVALMLSVGGCEKKDAAIEQVGQTEGAAAPTNRIDIPAAVRQNLGITFIKVESRQVARTLRLPGRFELLPTARREYRTPLPGRVEPMVAQYARVEAGTPLYRIDSAEWQDLKERIASTQAKVDSMGPLREAHRKHEESLSDKVVLWQERLVQLEQLRDAGGGSASSLTEVKATLIQTQADLADVLEKDAELEADQKQAEAELRSLVSRLSLLSGESRCADPTGLKPLDTGMVVCAIAPGIVETINMAPGGVAELHGLVLSVVQPEQIRFRAVALQADLGQLRDGLPAAVVPQQGGSIPLQDAMQGELQLAVGADADARTIDVLVQPKSILSWAKAGVTAQLEVTLEGGEQTLAVPLSTVVRDGATPILFRRDPSNPDLAIRIEADIGLSDGRWIAIGSGVKEGDEIVLGGNYQLMLATSGSAQKGGHFHSDGTFHEGEHE